MVVYALNWAAHQTRPQSVQLSTSASLFAVICRHRCPCRCRMLWIIAIVNFVYAPLMIFLRNPPGKQEKQVTCCRLVAELNHARYSLIVIADRTNGRAYAIVLRLSSVRNVLWLNG